jgi:hypothetical protein
MTAGQGRHGQSWCAAFIFGPAPGARVRTEQERTAILDQHLMAVASQGGRVESRTADAAVVVTGKPVNHLLHLLPSLFLCTMGVSVWLIMAAVGGERRATISVDPTGGVHRQQASIRRVGSFRLSWLCCGVCSSVVHRLVRVVVQPQLMTEKIAARTFVFVFALLFSIVVLGCSLPTEIEAAVCMRDVLTNEHCFLEPFVPATPYGCSGRRRESD